MLKSPSPSKASLIRHSLYKLNRIGDKQHGTRRFSTVFTRSRHMCLSRARSIQSTSPIQLLHLTHSYHLLLGRNRYFQDGNSRNDTKLADDRRVMTSKFILDITSHLNNINIKIEGKCKLLRERSRKSYNIQHVS
jgi:hypothetical protein